MTAIKSLPADTITLGKQEKTPAAVVTSKSQSLYLPPEDSDESEESPGPSTYVQGSQQQLNRFLKLCDVNPVCSVLSVLCGKKPVNARNAIIYERQNNQFSQC